MTTQDETGLRGAGELLDMARRHSVVDNDGDGNVRVEFGTWRAMLDFIDATGRATLAATPAPAGLDSSILRENETWSERCQELMAENAALRAVVDDLASAARDAQRAVKRGDYEAWVKPRKRKVRLSEGTEPA